MYKKIICILCVILFVLSFSASTFADSYNSTYSITDYDISMDVDEHNAFTITESINVHFNATDKHGIFRTIPLTNDIHRQDGSTSKTTAKISNVECNYNFETSRDGNDYTIKIGDADSYADEYTSYILKYKYQLSNDTNINFDELYFNIIGTSWDTRIDNVTFTINMPKEFDASKLGFTYGEEGSLQTSAVSYNVAGNTIQGSLNYTLSPGEALTVRLELPDDYFIKNADFTNVISVAVCSLTFVFVCIAFILWKKYGKDNEVIKTVEFYPPEDLNSLEVGYIYSGAFKNTDVVSLLIYLANKGYLKIEELDDANVFSANKFMITKLKNYDGENQREKLFLDGLFKTKDTVFPSELNNSFYKTVSKISDDISKLDSKIFEAANSPKTVLVAFFALLTFLLSNIVPIYSYYGSLEECFTLPFVGIGLFVMVKSLISNKGGARLFQFAWGGLFSIPVWCITILPAVLSSQIMLTTYALTTIMLFIQIIFVIIMPKRTSYGTDMLGKIQGFKDFLANCEKAKMEELVNQTPEYFYDVLPFIYVLGISSKWIENFEGIITEPPTWYVSHDTFSVHHFNAFMNSTISNAGSTMTSSPSSSSGGTGGGSSGGGSGGGGGGSW